MNDHDEQQTEEDTFQWPKISLVFLAVLVFGLLNRHPIPVYLPYLAGTADERQYRVMTDRESWFRIVMGQEEVARIIPNEE